MPVTKSAIILLGPPGSGKTTIAQKLTAHRDVTILATGRLLRNEIERDSVLGRKLRVFLDVGQLAPNDLVMDTITSAIKRLNGSQILFDGFPRRLDQIEPFFHLGKNLHYHLSAIIVLNLSKEISFQRLTGRRICGHCGEIFNIHFHPPVRENECDKCHSPLQIRHDDKAEVVEERLKHYEIETAPVVQHFQQEFPRITHKVSSEAPAQSILSTILPILQ